MTVEIEYVPNRTETVQEIVGEPEDDDEVLSTVEDGGGTWYKVEREITVTEECYRVYTSGARGSKSWFYVVEENEGGEWEVTTKEMSHGRTNQRIKQSPESTEAVREALREEHGIEVVN